MPQLKVLFLVGGGEGVNMTQLARTLGMTLPTLTGVVDRLVGQGLVCRRDDPRDRRVVLLYPTKEGTALLDQFIRAGRQRLRLILDQLSLANLRKVAETLDMLYTAATSPQGTAEIAGREAAAAGRRSE
ncbi:MAG: MarR family transcriptional regulator [Dehalococcoidales bacterium]|nr:MarR family transcriptional regulator [Dehalococcoidales bacterium]